MALRAANVAEKPGEDFYGQYCRIYPDIHCKVIIWSDPRIDKIATQERYEDQNTTITPPTRNESVVSVVNTGGFNILDTSKTWILW